MHVNWNWTLLVRATCRSCRPGQSQPPPLTYCTAAIMARVHACRDRTVYLENKGTLEVAQKIAAHESPRTSKLYDRTDDQLTLDEIEKISVRLGCLPSSVSRQFAPRRTLYTSLSADDILTICQLSVKLSVMRVIAKSRLVAFTEKYPDAAAALSIFYSRVKRADWNCVEDVRALYASADPVKVKSGRTVYVFNIRGNRYRLICAIHFNRRKLFIREFLTHADYSKGHWKTRH
jgi:mRNA interferase HigB